jgi:hypothetical protein
LAATESPDRKFLYYSKDGHSPSSIWRVPIDGGEETPVVDGLSYSLNFVVADRGLYFVGVGDAPHKTSLGKRVRFSGTMRLLLARNLLR